MGHIAAQGCGTGPLGIYFTSHVAPNFFTFLVLARWTQYCSIDIGVDDTGIGSLCSVTKQDGRLLNRMAGSREQMHGQWTSCFFRNVMHVMYASFAACN